MNKLESTVTEKYAGTKIVDYLKREMQLSVSLVKKVKFGGVFINGENVHMRAFRHQGRPRLRFYRHPAPSGDLQKVFRRSHGQVAQGVFFTRPKPREPTGTDLTRRSSLPQAEQRPARPLLPLRSLRLKKRK